MYGARPLNRVIQKDLMVPLSKQLLGGTIHDGDHVKVSASGDHLDLARA